MLVKQDTHNTIFRVVSENKNLHQNNLLYDHLFHTYMSYIAVGLRRQLKVNNDSISLRGLLADMLNSIDQLPNTSIGQDDIDNDIKQLLQTSQAIEDVVDKRLAHTDKREIKMMPSPNEIDECLRLIQDLHRNYNSVLKGEDVELMPTIYDWTDIFRIQWIQEK